MTPITLRTERLTLRLLSIPELEYLLADLPRLEAALGARYRGEALAGDLLDAANGLYILALSDPAKRQLPYRSLWLLLLEGPGERTVVGSACFKNVPENRTVEIGYGIGPDFRCRGYAAEAVRALSGWALAQPGVDRVLAETMPHNAASRRVLQKCGFVPQGKREGRLWWALQL